MENINKNLEDRTIPVKEGFGYNNSLAYFLLNSEISEKLNENVKKFITESYLNKREIFLKHKEFYFTTAECLTAMNNKIELFPQSTLADIYLPEE